MKRLTEKETGIMNHFWTRGGLFVKELQELYPEPRPHVNTLSTLVRILETKGFLSHKRYGTTYQYYPVVSREEYNRRSLSDIISHCFDNSYLSMVSSLVREEKISADELRFLIEQIENDNK